MDIYIYYIVPQIINFLMAVLIIPAIYITKIILKRDFFHSSDETIINLFKMKRNSLWVLSGILLLPPIIMMMLQYLNYAILLAYGGNVDVSSTLIQFQILYGLINSINIFIGILIILWALIITKKLNLWVFALITTSIFFLWSNFIIGEILLPANYALAFVPITLSINMINNFLYGIELIGFIVFLFLINRKAQLVEKLKEKFTSQNRRYNHIQGSDSQRFALIVFGIPIGIWISINSLLFVMNYGLTVFLPQIIFLPLIIVLIFLISGFFLTKIYTKDLLFPCFVVILLIPFFIPPVTSTLSQLQQAHDSLHYINIVSEPIDKYPVVLDNFRFVDSALFTDIIDSVKLPEPPKPYRVQVLDNYAAIGVVQGKPAFIAPMRYESTFLNPNTNVMAGYIALDLDNPIPESTIIKFTEMTIAPGLDGYKNIDLKLLQYAPDVFAGENYKYYLVDPWTDGHPAWIIPVSKYSPWGVDIPAGTVVVHSDGTFERLTVQESLQKGIPEPIAQDAFVNMIGSTIKFLRNNMIDPSSAGYLWLPSSPDVEQPITIDFYDRPHHILVNDHWFGRDYYLSARTGSKNSVVSWIMINNTIQMYDLRSYTKGGLVGVNTPDNALSDLSNIATSTGLANIDVRYPKLYRVPFGNATLLIWVSLLIETLPGYDRFAGAVFVDAANPRISGATVARLGESPQTFKERFVNAINLSYIGFLSGNQTISGQAQITNINNGTIIRTNWVLLQPNNQYGIVLYVKNQTKNIFILVTESSVATKDDFYTASILKPGDFVNIVARYDIDHQSWLAYKIQLL